MSSNSTGLDAPLNFQRSLYVGINLQAVIYGLNLCAYFKTMHIFLGRRKVHWKDDALLAVLSTAMLVLVTFIFALNASSGQSVWLVDQTHPSKPIAYAFVNVIAALFLVLQLLAYGFMTYHCQVVWNTLHVIVVPSVFWLGVVALGILSIWSSNAARTSLFGGLAGQLNLAYYSISIILSTMLTSLICYRLARYARMMKKQLGSDRVAPCFTIGLFLVESFLPLAVAGVAFLGTYWFKSPAEVAFLLVYSTMMCLSSQMLILRMAEGHAWRKDTLNSLQPTAPVETTMREDNLGRIETAIRLETLPEESHSSRDSAKEDKV